MSGKAEANLYRIGDLEEGLVKKFSEYISDFATLEDSKMGKGFLEIVQDGLGKVEQGSYDEFNLRILKGTCLNNLAKFQESERVFKEVLALPLFTLDSGDKLLNQRSADAMVGLALAHTRKL